MIYLSSRKPAVSVYGFVVMIFGVIIIASISVYLNSQNNSTHIYTYKIVHTYPHDPTAFTQGLAFDNGFLYEGTGLRGQSSIRKVELESGNIIELRNLSSELFGEGITVYQDKIYQVTWQSHTGFVYDKNSLELIDAFQIATEGWGLTHDGANLILSDGTSSLYFLDFYSYEEIRSIEVHDQDGPVLNINELEYVNGEVFANIWQTERIARINPDNGQVVGWIDLSGLTSYLHETASIDVLNGIAYDSEETRLFITGKLWSKLFQIEVTPVK